MVLDLQKLKPNLVVEKTGIVTLNVSTYTETITNRPNLKDFNLFKIHQ